MQKVMQWDGKTFENEVLACQFFQNHGFGFAGRNVSNPDTDVERHEVTLRNESTDRSVEITFAPPRTDGRPAVSQVYVVKPSTDEAFNFNHYIKQHHGVDLGSQGFCYSDYSGSFEERARAFLAFVTGLMSKYAEPLLQGLEWPQVEQDWAGHR